jgi:hypothetical protein
VSKGIHASQPAEDLNFQTSNIHSFTHENFSENGKPTLFTCNEVVRIDFGMAGYEVWYTYLPVPNDKVTEGMKNGVKTKGKAWHTVIYPN